MGQNLLPHVLANTEAEYPDAAKFNNNNSFLNKMARSLVGNGDFESFSAGAFPNWTAVGTGVVIAQDADKKHGSFAAKVTFGTTDAYLKQTAFEVNFMKGRTVKVWAWVKCSTPNIARIKVADGVATTASVYHTGDGTYQRIALEHAVAANATTLDLELHVEAAGNALFDAVVMVDNYDSEGFLPGFLDLTSPSSIVTAGRVNITGAANVPPTGNQLTKEAIVKAWLTFNGTTGDIISSFNIASVVRTAVGLYTVTFSTAFADTDYVMAGSVQVLAGNDALIAEGTGVARTASVIQIRVIRDDGSLRDHPRVTVMFIGNQ